MYNGRAMSFSVEGNDSVVMLDEKRDYWIDNKGNGPTGYFTKGPASDRRATCTTGDCFWETDTRKLYRCVGDNSWSFVYQPYAYPHPLTMPDAVARSVKKTGNAHHRGRAAVMYNSKGQMISMQDRMPSASGADVTTLPTGLYIVRTSRENEHIVKQVSIGRRGQ
jgi:hypothetical protein